MMRVPNGPRGEAALRSGLPKRRWVARLVTEVLAPAPVAAALLIVIAWHSAPTLTEAMRWGLVAVLFASVVPLLYVLRGVRNRRLTDHHVRVREQRPLPLLFGIGSVLIGLALLSAWGAPRELVALVGAMAAGLVVSLLITLVWKISIHVAVVAGAITILVLVFGPLLLAMAPLVILTSWARVELGDHTPAQVVAGAGLGTMVAAAVFTLLQ